MSSSDSGSLKTPLYSAHAEMGARLVSFSGWEMPVQYSSIREEHMAVRTGAGIFDVSHMGEFAFKGRAAIDLLQYLTTNDLESLSVGSCHYSFLLNASGGSVDDTMIYRLSDDEFLAVVNAGNIEKDWDHVRDVAQSYPGADVSNSSDNYALLAVQGPRAFELVQEAISTNLGALPFHSVVSDHIHGKNIKIATSGYTGENGLEIFARPEDVVDIWGRFLALGVAPCGLGARDTLRLEASLALYGHELDEQTSPIEARLGFAVAGSGEYLGSDAVAIQRKNGTQKTLVMIEMVDRAIPRQGYPILSSEGDGIGTVTSGSLAPFLNKKIGMGYVATGFAKTGTDVGIQVRDRVMKGKLVKRPFYKRPIRAPMP